jgi:hypothetical protein
VALADRPERDDDPHGACRHVGLIRMNHRARIAERGALHRSFRRESRSEHETQGWVQFTESHLVGVRKEECAQFIVTVLEGGAEPLRPVGDVGMRECEHPPDHLLRPRRGARRALTGEEQIGHHTCRIGAEFDAGVEHIRNHATPARLRARTD